MDIFICFPEACETYMLGNHPEELRTILMEPDCAEHYAVVVK